MGMMKVWGVVVIMAVIVTGAVDANSTCKTALNYLSPCKAFLVNVTELIPDDCCKGCLLLQRLVIDLKFNRKQKIALCKCLQKDGTQSGADADRAFQIVHTCNVTYSPILTGPDVNCSKYKFPIFKFINISYTHNPI
nr:non-specific lipid-transfer protein [Ipomoea batatas]